MYLCHSHTVVMAAMTFFTKIPEWQWHYDPTLDSLYMTSTSHIRLYIFFQRAFAVPIFKPLFDPMASFQVITLYMAHPAAVATHMAQLTAAPSQPAPPLPLESDPSEMRPPPLTLTWVEGTHLVTLGLWALWRMGSFLLILTRGVYQTLFEIVVYTEWSFFGIFFYDLGPQM